MPYAVVSSEQVNHVAALLAVLDAAPTPAAANRRRVQRLRLRLALPAYLLAVPGTPDVPIFTRNLSTQGLGFVSRRPFYAGELIALDFRTADGRLDKLILAEITFSRYLREALYEAGAKFHQSAAGSEYHGISQSRFPLTWIEMAQGFGRN